MVTSFVRNAYLKTFLPSERISRNRWQRGSCKRGQLRSPFKIACFHAGQDSDKLKDREVVDKTAEKFLEQETGILPSKRKGQEGSFLNEAADPFSPSRSCCRAQESSSATFFCFLIFSSVLKNAEKN